MKNYSIIKLSTMWSTNGLKNDVKRLLNVKTKKENET